MIDHKTVLILGAGASAPYGFPTGIQLKNEMLKRNLEHIIKSASQKRDHPNFNPLWRHILDRYGKDNLVIFLEALKRSGRYSVGAFLEHRPKLIDIGKALMAIELIKYENENSLNPEKGNWYQYIYNQLNASYEDFQNNNLSVITFNYDRSFEYCLLTYIQNDYDKTLAEAREAFSSIPVIHLHGSLGELSETEGNGSRKYSGYTTPYTIDICTDKIKIIHEDIPEDDHEFNEARKLISEAEVLWFLDFGYDHRNLVRLKIPSILKSTQRVFGTTFGLKYGEIIPICRFFNPDIPDALIQLDRDGNLDVLSYLRTNADWLS